MRHELPVGVPVNQDIRRVSLDELRRRRTAELMAMAHVDAEPADAQRNGLDELRVIGRIGISEYRAHRCDQGELVEYLSTSDIPGMENQADARECFVHSGSYQAMSVRDQADEVLISRHRPFYILGR
jgi:hypothetical protein